jgi:hypothetical protein
VPGDARHEPGLWGGHADFPVKDAQPVHSQFAIQPFAMITKLRTMALGFEAANEIP